jgi:hypothetical protein
MLDLSSGGAHALILDALLKVGPSGEQSSDKWMTVLSTFFKNTFSSAQCYDEIVWIPL